MKTAHRNPVSAHAADQSQWQRYLCPGEHGDFVARRDAATQAWLVARDPEHRPWTMAADAPFCLFCGEGLIPSAELDSLLRRLSRGSVCYEA
jgi:hypothetical protein